MGSWDFWLFLIPSFDCELRVQQPISSKPRISASKNPGKLKSSAQNLGWGRLREVIKLFRWSLLWFYTRRLFSRRLLSADRRSVLKSKSASKIFSKRPEQILSTIIWHKLSVFFKWALIREQRISERNNDDRNGDSTIERFWNHQDCDWWIIQRFFLVSNHFINQPFWHWNTDLKENFSPSNITAYYY